MRARPNLTGEQIVTDYLTRVTQAARLLPKGARMAFVGRTRALVEREVGPPGTRTDPEHVSAVLARLGKPEDLVTAERMRIDQGWLKSRAASKEEGEAAAAALTGPRMNRPFTARRRPNTPALDRQADPAWAAPDRHRPGRHRHRGSRTTADAGPRRSVQPGAGPRSSGARTTGLPGAGAGSAGARSGDSRTAGPRRLRSTDSPEPGPQGTVPPGAEPQAGHQAPGRRGRRDGPHRRDPTADRAGPGHTGSEKGPRRSPRTPVGWLARTCWRASPSCCSVLAG